MASTVVAVAVFSGLRRGEISALRREDYNSETAELQVVRAVWEGYVSDPKTQESIGVVPVIPSLKARLDAFESDAGTPIHFGNLVNRHILPVLNVCVHCRKSEADHGEEKHQYERNPEFPEWYGWHAFRRGLGTNLHALGVPSETVQRILRHSDVATTQRHYIKPSNETVHKAMSTLSAHLERRQHAANG